MRSIPLFRTMDERDLSALARVAASVEFSPGEELCRQGEAGMCLFIVASGSAAVLASREGGEPIQVAELSTGAVIGELSLIDSRPRSATVRATVPMSVLRIDRTSFLRLQRRNDPAAYKLTLAMAVQICGRLRAVNGNVSALMQDDLPTAEAARAETEARRSTASAAARTSSSAGRASASARRRESSVAARLSSSARQGASTSLKFQGPYRAKCAGPDRNR